MDPAFDPALDIEQTLTELDAAQAAGSADQTEISVRARAGEYTRFAGDRVHQPQDVIEIEYAVRAVVDGHPFRVATTVAKDLVRAVRAATDGARERAAIAGAGGGVQLARPGTGPAAVPPLWHDDTVAFDIGTRTAAARRTMADARAAGGDAAGMFGRAAVQQFVATSTGIRRATAATEALAALTVTNRDGTAHWVDVSRSADRLELPERVDDAIATAARGRGRTTAPDGEYVAVLGPEAVGELLGFLPAFGFSGLLASAGVGITQHPERVRMPAFLDVADDALADVGLPIGFDVEGVDKQRVPFFERGSVGNPVTDLATAAALRTPSTGHAHIAREQVPEPAAANIVMAAGTRTEADLIAAVDRGVYLQRFWYTRLVDATSGTITGVTRDACFLIENGRLTRPLAGARFTESVLGVLSRVDAIADRQRSQPVMNVWNGATSAPAIRTTSFRLGAAGVPGRP